MMRTHFLQTYLFLFLHSITSTHASLDVDGYVIDDSCPFSDANAIDPKGLVVARALGEIGAYIHVNILADVETGTSSERGFSAFFKTNANKDQVAKIFRSMTRGDVFTHRCLPGQTLRPTIHCVDADAVDSPDAKRCADKFLDRRITVDTGAFILDETPNVLHLCPMFFELPPRPHSGTCPTVRHNHMTHTTLADNQLAYLVHEIAHFYGATPYEYQLESCDLLMNENVDVNATEVYDVQGCAELDQDKQVVNAQNYALYFSGKSPIQKGKLLLRWSL